MAAAAAAAWVVLLLRLRPLALELELKLEGPCLSRAVFLALRKMKILYQCVLALFSQYVVMWQPISANELGFYDPT